jgi:hypothetical protein
VADGICRQRKTPMKLTKTDYQVIEKIAMRAVELLPGCGKIQTEMDMECVCETNPLRLLDLLTADNFNFCHDVCGIAQNLNRRSRKLENCFVPRFSK